MSIKYWVSRLRFTIKRLSSDGLFCKSFSYDMVDSTWFPAKDGAGFYGQAITIYTSEKHIKKAPGWKSSRRFCDVLIIYSDIVISNEPPPELQNLPQFFICQPALRKALIVSFMVASENPCRPISCPVKVFFGYHCSVYQSPLFVWCSLWQSNRISLISSFCMIISARFISCVRHSTVSLISLASCFIVAGVAACVSMFFIFVCIYRFLLKIQLLRSN